MVDFSSLKTQAEMALAKLTEGKCYEISDVNSRLQKIAAQLPQDTVINAVARVIEQLSKKDQTRLISQGEIENIYNQLIGLNAGGTRFREVLGDLLVSNAPKPVEQNLDYIRGMRDDPEKSPLEYDVNPQFKEDFGQMFKKHIDKYDPQCAVAAQEKVGMELKSLGYEPRIKLAGGNSKFLIFAADFYTPHGSVCTFIPSNAAGTQSPSVFIAGNKFNTLTKSAIDSFLSEASHKNSKLPHVSDVLNTIEKLSCSEVSASVSDAHMNTRPVEIPMAEVPEPLKALASQIEENLAEVSVGYPQNIVRSAKQMLISELDAMGFKNSQIRVASSMTGGFICEATLNTPKGKLSIEAPIEMNNDIPLLPAVFAKGDFVDSFDESSLHRFVSNNSGDNTIIRADSHFHEMTFAQLKDAMIKSAMRKDYDSCDEIIGVIASKVDENTYRNVVSDYHKLLLNVDNINEKLAYDDKDQFVKTPNSIYPIHKKLGKPAHELIRDENGEYHLKSTYSSRENQKESGAFFSNAKVLIGD